MKKTTLLMGITFSSLLISSILVFDTISASEPVRPTQIEMKQDEANKTLILEKIDYNYGEIIEFHGNASYPLPPLEIGDKITNCTGTIFAVLSDANILLGTWDFSGETNYSIVSPSYTIEHSESESKKAIGFGLILVLIAINLILFLKRKKN